MLGVAKHQEESNAMAKLKTIRKIHGTNIHGRKMRDGLHQMTQIQRSPKLHGRKVETKEWMLVGWIETIVAKVLVASMNQKKTDLEEQSAGHTCTRTVV